MILLCLAGHGNVAPKSYVGKMVAIAYACIGIPIIMLYLSTIGEALARNFRVFYSRICPARFQTDDFHAGGNCLRRRTETDCEKQSQESTTPFQAALNLKSFNGGYHWTCRDHTQVPIVLSLLVIILYIALGTLVFRTTEKWPIMDGCYFSFSSLATIGFGDLRPGLYASTVSAKAEDIAVGVCCMYILVGIVVIAMCFNLIQEDMRGMVRGVAVLCGGGRRVVHLEEKVAVAAVS